MHCGPSSRTHAPSMTQYEQLSLILNTCILLFWLVIGFGVRYCHCDLTPIGIHSVKLFGWATVKRSKTTRKYTLFFNVFLLAIGLIRHWLTISHYYFFSKKIALYQVYWYDIEYLQSYFHFSLLMLHIIVTLLKGSKLWTYSIKFDGAAHDNAHSVSLLLLSIMHHNTHTLVMNDKTSLKSCFIKKIFYNHLKIIQNK